jgi:hypothetical protein
MRPYNTFSIMISFFHLFYSHISCTSNSNLANSKKMVWKKKIVKYRKQREKIMKLKHGRLSLLMDPNLGDLSMTRMKLG